MMEQVMLLFQFLFSFQDPTFFVEDPKNRNRYNFAVPVLSYGTVSVTEENSDTDPGQPLT